MDALKEQTNKRLHGILLEAIEGLGEKLSWWTF
jgi:hypothetical protein